MHSGGEALQIGCPADLSGNPCRNDGVFGQAKLVYNGESGNLGTSKSSDGNGRLFPINPFDPVINLRQGQTASNRRQFKIVQQTFDSCVKPQSTGLPLEVFDQGLVR